ncbi:NAD-dependent malic enzyme [Neobacillus cucumis]|uniref:NAD(P)-dependent malic enzyme n=1 Tax=Neobacillus cucumis TaxID=1740721 RepID=UPI00203E0DF1|nr:malic enzyme-like NAD(P)-binding protein [Neobacillus cucumis]MCM3729501.1 NAD-dependent malic enzyme [Neobacillus cucumis]
MSVLREEALKMHKEHQGKLAVTSKVPVNNAKDLSLAYSPGVAEPCLDIHQDESKVYDYTMKGNLVAVVSNGTAVLGLGNIGPKAAMPVMEGKAVLFKSFANVDAFPICLGTTNTKEIVSTVKLLEPTFGGINLEDIAAPQCFEIEDQLRKACDIPVFHDDQHGTAIVTAAGLINALILANKKLEDIRVVVNGAGAAGVAIVKLLLHMGVKDVILCDTKGVIYKGRPFGMNKFKEEMAEVTNKEQKQGMLADALVGADVFVGVSAAGAVTTEMVRTMQRDPIIFAMANPVPEIMPEEAKQAGALVVGTGRSDYSNQVNNVLAFPGIFRGALDVQAREINEEMKIAAVHAIAGLISEVELHADYVIPNPFDKRVAAHVAAAVASAAMETGVSRKNISVEQIKASLSVAKEETKLALV